MFVSHNFFLRVVVAVVCWLVVCLLCAAVACCLAFVF